MSSFKPEVCGHTVLPDRSLWIGQKLIKIPKLKTSNEIFLSNFQTIWYLLFFCALPHNFYIFLCWHSEMEGKTEAWRIDLFASFFASISFYYQTFKEQPFLIFLLRKLLVHSRKKFCNVCQKQKIKRPFPHLCTLKMQWLCTVFENHRKSRIQHCERSELRLHFEWTKIN